ncbi:MAG: MGMT family protein [Candidatus Cloacimonetes bacterium]|nr:MGMT family protein [Candidatus Cloacimonadota bacterium]
MSELYEAIYHHVRCIPAGYVSTYGAIARLVGCNPRVVGYAMHTVGPDDDIPWHRVINSRGKISIADDQMQRQLLEAEGVRFSSTGIISLSLYGWHFEQE